MIDRKTKLRLYQVFFFLLGLLIIIFTYYQSENQNKDLIISSSLKQKINKQNQKLVSNNIFYNIKYSGFDLEGNRYTILSEEAVSTEANSELVNMKKVLAEFYFKDDTILKITSDEGIYNNKTLDIKFIKSVKAEYEESKLFAEEAQFLNSKNSLTVSKKVKVLDKKGILYADKLTFDVENKILNISSERNNVIKSKLNYK